MRWTLSQIAEQVGGTVQGDPLVEIESIATLEKAQQNQLTFLSNKKYKKFLEHTHAGVIILHKDLAAEVKSNAILVHDPYVAYAKAARLLNPVEHVIQGIDSTASVSNTCIIDPSVSIAANAVIEAGVSLAENVIIGPGCVVQRDAIIGKGSRLLANVTICHAVQLGDNCTVYPGAVIGADGFGLANEAGEWINIPQIGTVIIGNNVDVGANTTIDRGAIENTIIHDGVKLDNQIQIAHNVVIGAHTAIAGCVGIAGSTTIGKKCIIGGGGAIAGHLTIADNVHINGMAMVTKSLTESGSYSSGIPAEATAKWHRNIVRYRQLDRLVERVKRLEEKNND